MRRTRLKPGPSLRRRPRATLAGLMTILVVLAGVALSSSSNAQIVANPFLNVERAGHTATPLADGRILIVGGENVAARALHTATRLSDGSVLVAGGVRNGIGLSSTLSPWEFVASVLLVTRPRLRTPRVLSTAAQFLDPGASFARRQSL